MDAETQQLAEKLARFVAEGGPEVEAIAAERNRENPAFRSVNIYVCHCVFYALCFSYKPAFTHNIFCPSLSFLYDYRSPAHRLYKEKLQEYRAAASQSSSPPAAESGTDLQRPSAPAFYGNPPHLNSASQPHTQEAGTPPVKRKRKSRWGSEDDKVEMHIPHINIAQCIPVADPDIPCLSGA